MDFFRKLLIIFCYFFAYSTGLFTVYYDVQHDRFVQTRSLRYLAFLVNILMTMGLGILFLEGLQHYSIYDTNPMAKYTNIGTILLHTLHVSVSTLMRRWREKHVLVIMREVISLERRLFQLLPIRETSTGIWMDVIILLRIVLSVAHTTLIVISYIPLLSYGLWWEGIYVLYAFAVMNLMHGCFFHYCLILWLLSKRFLVLNQNLDMLLRRDATVVTTVNNAVFKELQKILITHYRLTGLAVHLNRTYRHILGIMIFSYVVNVIFIGYILVLIITGIYTSINVMNQNIGYILYVILICDIFIINNFAVLISKYSHETFKVLRKRTSFTQMPLTIERYCEWHTIHLAWCRFRFQFFDVITLGRRQCFLIMAKIAVYTIIIVQSDYRNIWK